MWVTQRDSLGPSCWKLHVLRFRQSCTGRGNCAKARIDAPTHVFGHQPMPTEATMVDDNEFRSRRQVLASAGRLSIGGVVAPALASAAVSSPAAAVSVPHLVAHDTEEPG